MLTVKVTTENITVASATLNGLIALILWFGFYISWGSSQPIMFFLLCAFYFFLSATVPIIVTGKLSMSSEEINYVMALPCLGNHQVRWDEIRKVEMNDKNIFFISREKTIGILGPKYWHGPEKQALEKLMMEEIQNRQISLAILRY